MAFLPIAQHGVIGDMYTAALVGSDGTIDWCCLPHFDSPSIFAAILDDGRGGSFRLATVDHQRRAQMYLPDTNVLITRFLSTDGVGEVVDFMPVQERTAVRKTHQIVRIARAVRGTVRFRLDCAPAFDFARQKHELILEGRGAVFHGDDLRFALISRFPLCPTSEGGPPGSANGDGVATEFTLDPGEEATFILRQVEDEREGDLLEARLAGEQLLDDTVRFWRSWLGRCTYGGRWREMIHRSALVLKLLTFEPTGAIVAAPTTSLPEDLGGVRNWDYRYTWIRDASLTLNAFLRLGYTEEAARFVEWLEDRARESSGDPPLQLMYRIDGRSELFEETVDGLSGYEGSSPVRVGNGAADQLQLDIYGELFDALDLYDRSKTVLSYDLWSHLRTMVDWVAANWQRDDEGIWEVRGGRRPFTYSKLQCWVALDRALRIAERRGLPLDVYRIRSERDRIYATIMERAYDTRLRTFVQSFGSQVVDASNLIMPTVGFVAPTDPRMLGTLDRTMVELVSDSLVYRYRTGLAADDGLAGEEGTFNMCTYWLVQALTRAGRIEESRFLFEKMLTYANHLGLYAEEIGPVGEALGNFPQAFTHLALINAGLDLDAALDAQA
jgi:GH15 family glucan-1,4-alpha-glucosidase